MNICEQCGGQYEPRTKQQKYCSEKCSRKAKYIRVDKDRRVSNGYILKSITYTCKHCGKEYHPKAKDRATFCSQSCYKEYSKQNAKPRPVYLTYMKYCNECGAYFETRNTDKCTCAACLYERHKQKIVDKCKAKARENYKETVKPRVCDCCGIVFTPHFGISWTNIKYCSDECRVRASMNSEAKKEERRRYRARKRNAYVAPVITKEIYQRDKGKCGICSKPIDMSLKHPHPMSLSLDHILPLACGGTHEPRNVQCAHLICNSTKSDGVSEQGEQLKLC